jgi:glycosyltransferase involved in cell wall biosynthesis
MMPRVSVVITAYNNEPFVEMAIRSILGQNYQDRELVVGDDRGRDKPYDIAKRFACDRVQVIRNERSRGRMAGRGFLGYMARTVRHKGRAAVGLPCTRRRAPALIAWK